MKVGVVAVIKGVVVWVGAAPLGRPVALTLGPPLNLPLGGEGDGSRERGHVVSCFEGVAVMGLGVLVVVV